MEIDVLTLLIDVAGLGAALLFILGMKGMASPKTAVAGIRKAGAGMLAVVAASLAYAASVSPGARPHLLSNMVLAAAALALGGAWAWWRGRKVPVTAMPQMVALYNGMGGGAAAAVGVAEVLSPQSVGALSLSHLSVAMLGAFIGAVSFSGSLIAWAKLDGRITRTLRFRGQGLLNGVVVLVGMGFAAWTVAAADPAALVCTVGLALAFGLMMTVPIGGADMPVVISLFNAFTGLAVALEGYALSNPALMVAGMMVGSSGTLLTLLMAKAMNRSIAKVLFARFGPSAEGGEAVAVAGRSKAVEARDAALTMRYASSVIVVPGYGLAVAQAQAKLYELVKLLQGAGVQVRFAIHPVAGRMPGHMNVLLAEAGVPYDLIVDMEDINDSFSATDVAIVIGANDVVNPAARTDKSSPIFGMPILNADQAKQVYVVKRGQGKGYAGVDNLLFYQENCAMVYGDALAVLNAMVQAVKEVGG